uniref:Protein tyrosine phosphatase n=1 Tax=Ditylenchus dipsaci TaxID=166011 RepID=A0A915DGX3_9BILA
MAGDKTFVHDLEKDGGATLDSFMRLFCAKDVFSKFSDYNNVVMQSKDNSSEACNSLPDSNRYGDVPCFDYNRVVVKHPTEEHDYIHASYVDGFREHRKFILTQAPLEHTIGQFWEMIWKEKVALIVSFAIIDGKKCPEYIPVNAGQQFISEPFSIKHNGTRAVRKAYDATMLLAQKGTEPPRKVLHLLFYRWPDKGTPTHVTEVLNFIEDMNFNRDLILKEAVKDGWISDGERTPILVHGIAGVGRSGSLVVMDICQRKLDACRQFAVEPKLLDVEKTVLAVRGQRAMAVNKPEQFLFIHLSLIEYVLRKHYCNSIEDVDLSNYTHMRQ